MSLNSVITSPVIILDKIENLWLELSDRNCNLKCKHCYKKVEQPKNNRNFLSIKTIKTAFDDLEKENIKMIYLTGGEPFLHPELNSILRLCLEKSSITILTNATFLNDKKARFLRRVEEESDYEIIFKLSVNHYEEKLHDDLSGRGTFRSVLTGIQSLSKQGFNPILNIVNFYQEDESKLRDGFRKLYESMNIDSSAINFHIVPYFRKSSLTGYNEDYKENEIVEKIDKNNPPECSNSRILTINGVYTCPILANDHRGRCGADFKDWSKKTFPDAPFCHTCVKNGNKIFTNTWSN